MIVFRMAFAAIIVSFSCSGCGTMLSQFTSYYHEQNLYQGVLFDVDGIRDLWVQNSELNGESEEKWLMTPLLVIDIPLSAVADTILLPVSMVR